MASHAAGARFISLLGGSMLSFYDWYADLPVASPQVFGDQTDVPESADWWNAAYLIMWGSNVPVTRTPDAHFMAEARYRGQKVVTVSPGLRRQHQVRRRVDGTASGHRRRTRHGDGPRHPQRVLHRATSPALRRLRQEVQRPALPRDPEGEGRRLGAGQVRHVGRPRRSAEGAAFKTVFVDSATGLPHVPNGSLGFRFNESGMGKWNLDLENVDPALSLHGATAPRTSRSCCRASTSARRTTRAAASIVEGYRPRRLATTAGERLVTTVFDLLLAQYGVGATACPGQWPTGYDDPEPYTPAWQEEITGVPAAMAERIGREFAQNAEDSGGRSMILMGAGTNHWFHSDTIYRTFLALTTLTGTQGVNGGGWAHYVGQEKCRPVTGWAQLAFGLDWSRPPRQMIGTGFWYVQTDQWRYDRLGADLLATPLGEGRFVGQSMIDTIAQSARSGWMPSYPQFDRNPLDIVDQAEAAGRGARRVRDEQLTSGEMKFAIEDPDAAENWPRVLTVWRANLLGSSSKGNEYFLKHLLGTDNSVRATETPESERPRDITWHDEAPRASSTCSSASTSG